MRRSLGTGRHVGRDQFVPSSRGLLPPSRSLSAGDRLARLASRGALLSDSRRAGCLDCRRSLSSRSILISHRCHGRSDAVASISQHRRTGCTAVSRRASSRSTKPGSAGDRGQRRLPLDRSLRPASPLDFARADSRHGRSPNPRRSSFSRSTRRASSIRHFTVPTGMPSMRAMSS